MITTIDQYIYLLWIPVVSCIFIIVFELFRLFSAINQNAEKIRKSLPGIKEHLEFLRERTNNISIKVDILGEKIEKLVLNIDSLKSALGVFSILNKALSRSFGSLL